MKKIIRSLFAAIVIAVMGYPIGTVHPATTTTITVNSTDDSIAAGDNVCTLREAIIAANTNQRSGLGNGECDAGNAFGTDTIIVPPGIYTLTITGQDEDTGLQGDLDITTSMSIQGAGPIETIIQGGTSKDDSVDRVFHVNTLGSVHFEGLTIQYGKPVEAFPNGGGILIQNGGTTTIDNCWVNDNHLLVNLVGGGGGIAHTGSGTLSVVNSALHRNFVNGSDTAFGGGIYVATQGILNVANSTFDRNSTTTSGGGLYNLGEAYLSNVTMTWNEADVDHNDIGTGGGIAGTGTTVLKNSLLSNHDYGLNNWYPEINGNVQSADYNILANLGDEQEFLPAEHDLVGDSTNRLVADLGLFEDSSGSHQLHSTSLVLDQIPAGACTYQSGGVNPLYDDGEPILRDQRGAPRPNGSSCDIGAREFYSLSVSTAKDTLEDDGECSLREAITTANTGRPSGQSAGECVIPPDGIDLPPGTYTLEIEGTDEYYNQTGDLNILSELVITGAGAGKTIIQAGQNPGSGIDRVMRSSLTAGTLEINNLTIRHGQTESEGAGVHAYYGRIMLKGVSISDNSAEEAGGGLYCEDHCNIFISDSSVVGNQSLISDGGGLFVALSSTLVIANSTISENQAANHGGGIYGSSYVYLSNTTITSNTADSDQDGGGDGGGIHFYPWWNLKNSVIADNIDRGGEKPDVSNPHEEITSLDYNLIGDIGTQSFTAGTHDIVGISAFPEDPELGELTGTPAYQMPEPGSRVIDAIPPINCTYTSPDTNKLFSDGEAITSDQTGADRPVDGDQDGHFACDIGAVEYIPTEVALVYLPLVLND